MTNNENSKSSEIGVPSNGRRYFRYQCVSVLIKEELSKLIIREVETPGALVTVTDVDVTKKLDLAVVKFSVIPMEKAEDILKILNKSRGELQHLLLKKINIKPMPHIVFEINHGLEHAAKIEKILMEDDKIN